MLLAMAIAWLIARGIHVMWPQPRPAMLGVGTHWVERSGSASFPSRHATIGLAGAPHRVAGALCFAAGVLIAWSRVALGAHFPADVLAGAVIAAASALAARWCWRWPWRKR
jgi:undecaprenyl-diphosphatase